MPTIRTTGLEAVSRELARIKRAQAPAILAAVADATAFGHQLAVDTVFARYGFRDQGYVAQHLSFSVDAKSLEGRVSGRYRPSSLGRFTVREHQRPGKRGGQVPAGITFASVRSNPVWFKGAFAFIGRNGNRLIAERKRGDNSWRSLKGRKLLYGPSVAGSFGVIRDDISPQIAARLRERYGRG